MTGKGEESDQRKAKTETSDTREKDSFPWLRDVLFPFFVCTDSFHAIPSSQTLARVFFRLEPIPLLSYAFSFIPITKRGLRMERKRWPTIQWRPGRLG